MAFINLSIGELFMRTFGEKPDAYNFNKVEKYYPDIEAITPENKRAVPHGKYGSLWAKDKFGRDYYLPATISFKNTHTQQIVPIELPYALLSFDGKWNMVRTQLTQRSGTFKQMVGLDDYSINIRGLLVSKDNNLPEKEIDELKYLFEYPGPKFLNHALTDIPLSNQPGGKLGVVIESLKFPETRGVVNTRGYEMKLYTDSNFNLVEGPPEDFIYDVVSEPTYTT